MGHPVTTNPVIIMLINMTVVFIVLISLSYLIKLIHMVDPTAKKEEEAKTAAPAVAPTPAPVVQNVPVIDDRIPEEVVAVIFAAIAGYGYATGQVHAIHPVYHKVWEHSGRYQQPPQINHNPHH